MYITASYNYPESKGKRWCTKHKLIETIYKSKNETNKELEENILVNNDLSNFREEINVYL